MLVVRKKLLLGMCEEFRTAFVPEKILKDAPPITGREVELVWNLHGSMFYWAVRQHIFGAKPAGTGFEDRTGDAVDLFLAGAQVQYPIVVADAVQALKARKA